MVASSELVPLIGLEFSEADLGDERRTRRLVALARVLAENPSASFPEAAGEITDCLSGDVNKDYSSLWKSIREFIELPDDLPYGEPLLAAQQRVQFETCA